MLLCGGVGCHAGVGGHSGWHADPLTDRIEGFTDRQAQLLLSHAAELVQFPAALPKVLRCVRWTSLSQSQRMWALLPQWAPPRPEMALQVCVHTDSRITVPYGVFRVSVPCVCVCVCDCAWLCVLWLQLLDSPYQDELTRAYAVRCTSHLSDISLRESLLQLVQALKFEPHHNSYLARFLLRRALRARHIIGHHLFWLLKVGGVAWYHLRAKGSAQLHLPWRL